MCVLLCLQSARHRNQHSYHSAATCRRWRIGDCKIDGLIAKDHKCKRKGETSDAAVSGFYFETICETPWQIAGLQKLYNCFLVPAGRLAAGECETAVSNRSAANSINSGARRRRPWPQTRAPRSPAARRGPALRTSASDHWHSGYWPTDDGRASKRILGPWPAGAWSESHWHLKFRVCDQVVRTAGSGPSVHWHGGAQHSRSWTRPERRPLALTQRLSTGQAPGTLRLPVTHWVCQSRWSAWG